MSRKTLMLLVVVLILLALAQPVGSLARAQEGATAQTTATMLNVREGPGDGHPVIAGLRYGTRVIPQGRSADGFWILVQASAPATRGWVTVYYLVADAGVDLMTLPVTNEIVLPDAIPPAEPEPAAAGAPTGDASVADWLFELGVISNVGPRAREIYLQGLAMGNNPRAFSKFGDCNSRTVFYLSHFDRGEYLLGPYEYLQPVIDHFAGSYSRDSMTVWGGGRAWMVFDPLWANPAYCEPGETPIACEYRTHRPSVALIAFGTKEMGHTQLFEDNLRAIVEFSIANGVIPVLSTKADSLEGAGQPNNDIIRQVAAEYGVPLWDWGQVAATLPHNGLWDDGNHLGWFPLRYNDSRALRTGHSLRNLTALVALDAVWRGAMY